MNSIAVTTKDDVTLAAYHFSATGKCIAKIIIAPAMGAAQSYYQHIASWLTKQGFDVITFDYRGMGESRRQHLKHYKNDILDWATLDCSAILAQVIKQNNDTPIYWIGHSLGGQIFPLIDQIEKVSKVITVASGTGYWRHNAPQLKRKIWWFWFLIVPLSLRVYGYFPGKRIGMVGDLPKPVMQQWRRWCMHPKYCVGVESDEIKNRFSKIEMPIRSLAIDDDEMLSSKNIQAMFSLFGSQDKVLTTLVPEELGVKRIGHLGFFREEFANSLWTKTLLPELNSVT